MTRSQNSTEKPIPFMHDLMRYLGPNSIPNVGQSSVDQKFMGNFVNF